MTSLFGGEIPERIVVKGRQPRQPQQRENTGADRLWKAVRILRRFTRTDLVVTTGEATENVWSFIRRYRDAGYLRVTAGGNRRAGQEATWALVKDPGPKRPPYKKREGTSDGKELD